MDVPGYLAERVPLVDARLNELLPPTERPPCGLHAAMRHLIFPGGKRLRPMLCFATAEAFGQRPDVAVSAAAAVELIHSYSLIHDDLPCMDDDALRRGRPSVHVAFGESTAVLAGDALQALAFEALTDRRVDDSSAVGCVRELAAAAGASGLVGGQADDLGFERTGGEPPTLFARRIESVHQRKTARLIAAAIACGARLAGADEEWIGRLRSTGDELGVAYQIADDWLDRDRDEACSLVRVTGADAALERARELLDSALARVEALGDAAEPLRELMRFSVHRSS